MSSILQNLLYLRRLANEHGILGEMAPERTRDEFWYPKRFKNGLAQKLIKLIESDAPSPLQRPGGKGPTPFVLGQLFRGAGRYSDHDLVAALAKLGAVETALRGDMPREALSVWLTSFQGGQKAIDWGGLMAGSVLFAMPVIIFFVIVQGRIQRGALEGGVKG